MSKQSERQPKNFEEALKRLQAVVDDLENGELSLEQSLERYEHGVGLSRFCHEKLEEAEKRISVLRIDNRGEPLVDAAGEPRQQDLHVDDDSDPS